MPLDAGSLASSGLRTQSAGLMRQLQDTNIGEMIESLARGIAQAQFKLDLKSIEIAQVIAGLEIRYPSTEFPNDRSRDLVFAPQRIPLGKTADGKVATFSLLELGFTPAFYHFVETTLEVKISVSMNVDTSIERSEKSTTTTKEKETSIGWGKKKTKTRTNVTTVSSHYSARFQYSVEGSSLVRTRLIPVAPPSRLLDVINEAAAERQFGKS